MTSTLPVLRARRERRLEKQRRNENRSRGAILSLGLMLSLVLGVLIILGTFAYSDVTRDLPSPQILPRLLNPPDGLLLQPTRVYDRTGLQLLATFAPSESPRRYIPISEQNAQHVPEEMVKALIAAADPSFESHSGYSLEGFNNYDLHPTIAQKLVSALMLYNEPPTWKRAIRERLLAVQITSQFGRTQIMEWYLNSADFGNYAYGIDAAAQLYFGKPADELTLAESAILAATSESPALNPHDAPLVAIQRGRELLYVMNDLGLVTAEEVDPALAETPTFAEAPLPSTEVAPAFLNLLLSQVDSQIPRDRIERGGITVISTLDYDLQKNAACVTELYAVRLANLPETEINCDAEENSRPCKGDVEKFCKDAKIGGVAKCLKEHEAELSPECKAKGEKIRSAVQEAKNDCEGDSQKFCKGIKEGGGRIIRCLKEHEAELSEACKAHAHWHHKK